MKLLPAILAGLLLVGPSLRGAVDYPSGKLVLADYTPHHITRPNGNGLDLWRWDGNALSSQASVTRRISNGDLIGDDGRNQVPCTVYPAVGMQSEEDEDYIEYQILQAKAARIDGFMIEWNSPGKTSNIKLREVAERLGFLVGAVWQADQTLNFIVRPTYGSNPTAAEWNNFLANHAQMLRQELYSHPTTPMVGGRPLLLFFAWGCPGYTTQDLTTVRSAWSAGAQPLFARTLLGLPDAYAAGNFRQGIDLVDGFYPWSTPGSALSEPTSSDSELAPLIAANTHDSYYTGESMLAYRQRWLGYTKAFESQGLPLRMGGVMGHADNRPCGGWGSKVFYVARKDGETARQQWELYKSERNNLDVILVATWNDWTEGTIVEPSVERGLQDVTIIEAGAAGFKAQTSDPSGLPLPKRLFELRKGYGQLTRLGFPQAGPKARLDAVAEQMAKRQYAAAENAIALEETRLLSLQRQVVTKPSVVSTPLTAGTIKTSTTSTPVWMNLSSALDAEMSTLRCDAELTWEWLDADYSSYQIFTNTSGTASTDAIAEILGSGTGVWKTARIRVYDQNCWFTRDAVIGSGKAVLKFTGNATFRNVVFTATRKDLPPVISIHPSGGAIIAGRPYSMSIEAGGTGTVTYQWRKNGALLQGVTSGTLTFPTVGAVDTGTYDCVVSVGTASVTSASASVEVLIPPSIEQPPAAGTVDRGATATFSVSAAGAPPLLYQWSKNGVSITGGTAASLVINPVQTTDAGSYSVTVSNAAGSVTSVRARLTVNRTAPNVFVWPTASAIQSEQALESSTLSGGSASVAGGFSFTAPATIPGLGTTLQPVTFTPADLVNYSTVGGSVSVTVTPVVHAPVITSATTAAGTVGFAFSYQIVGTNSPTSYSASGLPAGLTVNPDTGLISGTPTVSGQRVLTLGATNGGGTRSAMLTLNILSPGTSGTGAHTVSWSDVAGTYEGLLEHASDAGPNDGAVYRGAFTLTLGRTGLVSGRVFYNEATELQGVPNRLYTPVTRVFSTLLTATPGSPLIFQKVLNLGSGPGSVRQELTLAVSFVTTPPTVNVTLKDLASPGQGREAWVSRSQNCQRSIPKLPAVGAITGGSLDYSKAVGRYTFSATSTRSDGTASDDGYVLVQLLGSGRLVWTSRLKGSTGTGSAGLQLTPNGMRSWFYEGSSGTTSSVHLSTSVLGCLNFTPDTTSGDWSTSVGSIALPDRLEKQASCVFKRAGRPVYEAGNGRNWSGVTTLNFSNGEGIRWGGMTVTNLPSFWIGTSPDPLMLTLSAQDPLPDGGGHTLSYAWNVSITASGKVLARPAAGLATTAPPLMLNLDRTRGEFSGYYISNTTGRNVRRSIYGCAIYPGDHTLRARGWVEAGALPTVFAGTWTLGL